MPPKAPRVKGSLQPASAARASSLDSGTVAFGFGASSVGSESGGTVDSPSLSRTLSTLGTKRDPKTLGKALEETLTLLPSLSKGDALSLLTSHLPGLLGKGVLSPDKKLREGLFRLLQALIDLNGPKALGPALQTLMGPWLLGLLDPNPNVSSAAKKALQLAFPTDYEGKLSKAGTVTQGSLLVFVTDLLLHQTRDSLCDPRFVSQTEAVETHARVIAGAIGIISWLLTRISAQGREQVIEEYSSLLSQDSLWALLASNPLLPVRKAFYSLIKTLADCQDTVLLDSCLPHITTRFLSKAFGDLEPGAQGPLWDALLTLTKIRPEIWIEASKKKSLIRKYLAWMRTSAVTVGDSVYPSQLALLAHILPISSKCVPSSDASTDSTDTFPTDFLDALWAGGEALPGSHPTLPIFLSSYFECSWFLLIQTKGSMEVAQRGFIMPFEAVLLAPSSTTETLKAQSLITAWSKSLVQLAASSQVQDSWVITILEYVNSSIQTALLQGNTPRSVETLFSSLFHAIAESKTVPPPTFKKAIEANLVGLLETLLRQLKAPISDTATLSLTLAWLETAQRASISSDNLLSALQKWMDTEAISSLSTRGEAQSTLVKLCAVAAELLGPSRGSRAWSDILSHASPASHDDDSLSLLSALLDRSLSLSVPLTPILSLEQRLQDLAECKQLLPVVLNLLGAGKDIVSRPLHETLVVRMSENLATISRSVFAGSLDAVGALSSTIDTLDALTLTQPQLCALLGQDRLVEMASHLQELGAFSSCSSVTLAARVASLSTKWTTGTGPERDLVLNKSRRNFATSLCDPINHHGTALEFSAFALKLMDGCPSLLGDILLKTSALERPSFWARDLTVLHPYLVSSNSSESGAFKSQDWFNRYISFTEHIVKSQGPNLTHQYPQILLDWTRHVCIGSNWSAICDGSVSVAVAQVEPGLDALLQTCLESVTAEADWEENALKGLHSRSHVLGLAVSKSQGTEEDALYLGSIASKIMGRFTAGGKWMGEIKKFWEQGKSKFDSI